ncbi:Bug family tripartite tricarboxylate transporter substrate binding protein [Belnapia rosea]|uniref:Tripartite-type tricarboxylate transporter, receptor component TctC n=1 Tax=Belnapia rosea TaxID=938405 RepID=A0A1G6KJP6_9PROT|nr:tripartite tricarboxylate transporter substrate-binding protein [Belnapia rosea]SDB18907.1 Tripartite-type tricarboxylate transporter, receptor component TctC [Belnapia rosea]SDC30765.1 Tripartite-type tricarboxylate transporter, receptor component TctC [Belnapia rosea]
MLTRRAALGTGLLLAAPAIAQPSWPNGPIRLVAPFPPGGSVDAISRLLQQPLSASLGVPVVVENRAGASGAIGTRDVARAAPDGNSWVLVFDTHAVNPALIANLGFDTQKDLAPVLLIGTTPMLINAFHTRPWQDFGALVAAAKAKPETITYGTIGNGSLAHLTMKLVERELGISLVHVPYRGGGPLGVAASSGEVDLPTATGTIFVPQLEAKTIRPLASTGTRRSSVAPQAPTLTELGVKVTAEAFWGVLGPAATPAPIRARMEAALRDALAVPAVRERLTGTLGVDVDPKGEAEFAGFLDRSIETWGRVVRENGIRPD